MLHKLLKGAEMFEQTFKNIDDVLWKETGCATELDYAEQTSWMLFLKYLNEGSNREAEGTVEAPARLITPPVAAE
jgi:type I restriction enzyme M protein